MDIAKLLALAGKYSLPQIALDIVNGVELIKATAARSGEVLSSADEAELDEIHERALDVNAELDAKLAAAEQKD